MDSPKPIGILVVEDDLETMEGLVEYIRQFTRELKVDEIADVRVEGNPQSQRALEWIMNYPDAYDIVVTDHNMLPMSGMELAQKIRRWEMEQERCTGQFRRRIQIIMITGQDSLRIDDAIALHDKEVLDHVLTKPPVAHKLDDVLTKTLKKICLEKSAHPAAETREMALQRLKHENEALKKAVQYLANTVAVLSGQNTPKRMVAPFRNPHGDPLILFEQVHDHINAWQEAQLNYLTDWEVDRGTEKACRLWGIQDIRKLEKAAFGRCRSEMEPSEAGLQSVTLCLGPGDGTIMRELDEEQVCTQVGMADTLYVTLQEILKEALKPSAGSPVMLQFIDLLSTALLNHEMAQGQLVIKIGNLSDENRLRHLLKNPHMIRSTAFIERSVEFPGDKVEAIEPELQTLLQQYVADPEGFLAERFVATLHDAEAIASLKTLIPQAPENVRLCDFREMQDIFEEQPGTCFVLAHESRALSHLEDAPYQNAVSEIAARLHPGGMMIGDGWKESYTRHYRVGELRAVEKHLGPEYRFSIIGNREKPFSVLIERGLPLKKGFAFSDAKALEPLLAQGMKSYALAQFESQWPELAHKNQAIKLIRKNLFEQAMVEIASRQKDVTLIANWRSRQFKDAHPLIDWLFDQKWQTVRWSESALEDFAETIRTDFCRIMEDKTRLEHYREQAKKMAAALGQTNGAHSPGLKQMRLEEIEKEILRLEKRLPVVEKV